MYESLFDGIKHDSIAALELWQLRATFKGLEKAFHAGSTGVLSNLHFPQNEYFPLVQHHVEEIMTTPFVTPENLQSNLRKLEIVYFLVGKDIRKRLIDRLLNPALAHEAPAWIKRMESLA